MKKILNISFLLAIVSCGQNTGNIKASQLKDTASSTAYATQNTAPSNTEKHQTFNETIDTLREVLKAFIPSGYSAINVSSGDANLDGLTDEILVLRKNTEESTSNYADNKPDKRALLLLLGQSDGSFKPALRNENAVYCIDCGGAFGDPFTGTTIKDGYFSIEHGIAGGQHWEQVTTFKFDKSKGNWFLYKDHLISYKLNESNDEDADALVKDTDKLETAKDFGIVPFDEFNIYSDRGH